LKENECRPDELLPAYLSLWQNRRIEQKDFTPRQILQELVRRELLDENAHPRARKSLYEKFYLSVKRVIDSNLSAREQTAIIAIYVMEFERIQRDK